MFEEDKGFWAAIQTFMNTTKRPIVMTTSDRLFVHKFDPKGELKMETLHLRTPNLVGFVQVLEYKRKEYIFQGQLMLSKQMI